MGAGFTLLNHAPQYARCYGHLQHLRSYQDQPRHLQMSIVDLGTEAGWVLAVPTVLAETQGLTLRQQQELIQARHNDANIQDASLTAGALITLRRVAFNLRLPFTTPSWITTRTWGTWGKNKEGLVVMKYGSHRHLQGWDISDVLFATVDIHSAVSPAGAMLMAFYADPAPGDAHR